MPLYEYHCKKCAKDMELLVSKPDAPVECPECGSHQLTKLLSVVSSPVIQGANGKSASSSQETCGKPACARGCMFGN